MAVLRPENWVEAHINTVVKSMYNNGGAENCQKK